MVLCWAGDARGGGRGAHAVDLGEGDGRALLEGCHEVRGDGLRLGGCPEQGLAQLDPDGLLVGRQRDGVAVGVRAGDRADGVGLALVVDEVPAAAGRLDEQPLVGLELVLALLDVLLVLAAEHEDHLLGPRRVAGAAVTAGADRLLAQRPDLGLGRLVLLRQAVGGVRDADGGAVQDLGVVQDGLVDLEHLVLVGAEQEAGGREVQDRVQEVDLLARLVLLARVQVDVTGGGLAADEDVGAGGVPAAWARWA